MLVLSSHLSGGLASFGAIPFAVGPRQEGQSRVDKFESAKENAPKDKSPANPVPRKNGKRLMVASAGSGSWGVDPRLS